MLYLLQHSRACSEDVPCCMVDLPNSISPQKITTGMKGNEKDDSIFVHLFAGWSNGGPDELGAQNAVYQFVSTYFASPALIFANIMGMGLPKHGGDRWSKSQKYNRGSD